MLISRTIDLQGLSGEFLGIRHGLFGDYVYYSWYCTDFSKPYSGTEGAALNWVGSIVIRDLGFGPLIVFKLAT